jgi:hypothetical protein
MGEAAQAGTTEIYLQLPPGATQQQTIKIMTELKNGSMELRGKWVSAFGPDGDLWWSGEFGGPQ